MLTQSEMAEARNDYAKTFLSALANISRTGSGTPDNYGGRDKRREFIASGVPCRVQRSRRPQSITEGSRFVPLGEWEVLLPTSSDVRPSDIITVGSAAYEVKGTDDGTSEALCLTAYCTRIENNAPTG